MTSWVDVNDDIDLDRWYHWVDIDDNIDPDQWHHRVDIDDVITEWLFVTSYSENLYYAFEFRGRIHNISGHRLTIVVRKANLRMLNYCWLSMELSIN